MTIEATPGASNANSYVTLVEAQEYLDAVGSSSWCELVADDQEALLILATRWIDGAYGHRFLGTRTNGRSQSLQWPRSGAADDEGNSIPDNEIPIEVKRSVYEAVLVELNNPDTLSFENKLAGTINREKIGPIEVEYQSEDQGEVLEVDPAESIYPFIRPLVRITSFVGVV